MRLAAGLVVAVMALVYVAMMPTRHSAGELRKARTEGREAAEEDIAKGTPRVRRRINTFGHLPRDGVAVDRETGLPLANTAQWCGTCARLWGDLEAASNEGYNACIREAFTAGRLQSFRLDRKLRDKATLRTLFATGQPTVLKGDGATASVGEVGIALYEDEELRVIELTPASGGHRVLYPRYPYEYADAPKTLSMQYAPGPFEVLIVDEETTAIFRDGVGYAWIYDLPRGIILEVIGPIG